MFSKGAEKLARRCQKHGQVTAIAVRLGASQSLVSRWIHGVRVPSPRWRARIQDELGIGWRSWDEPADEQREAS